MTQSSTMTDHVVVGTATGLHLLDAPAPPSLPKQPVTAVLADGDRLWVLTDRRHLHQVVGGRAELVASLDGEQRATCLGAHGATIWIGGDDALLWRLDGVGVTEVTSFQEAPSRAEWHTPWGGPPAIFSMASDGTDLYVSVHVGGILRSTDGTSWRPTIDLHDDVHQVAVGPDGRVWAATGARGLAESADGGDTWRYHTTGLHATYLLTVAATNDAVLVGASSGHAGRDGAIYRFDGERFSRVEGLPDALDGAVGPRQLAAAGDRAAVALPNGDLYTSGDGGRHWTLGATGLPSVSEVALAAPTGTR